MPRRLLVGFALTAALVGTALAAAPAQATLNPPCPIDQDCGGETGGSTGGGGGTPQTYTLQGVIQHNKDLTDGQGRRAEFRGYSRLADADNNRVDADYINVRCYARDFAGYTTDYDSENNGALVDVTFQSNTLYGALRTITVDCVHHAEKNGIVYDTTSTLQYNVTY